MSDPNVSDLEAGSFRIAQSTPELHKTSIALAVRMTQAILTAGIKLEGLGVQALLVLAISLMKDAGASREQAKAVFCSLADAFLKKAE